jgi:hypothetical protein
MSLRSLGGYVLLIIGVAGCLLPIIPGFPFLLAGAAVLGWDHWAVRPWAKHLRKVMPGNQASAPAEGSASINRDGSPEK